MEFDMEGTTRHKTAKPEMVMRTLVTKNVITIASVILLSSQNSNEGFTSQSVAV